MKINKQRPGPFGSPTVAAQFQSQRQRRAAVHLQAAREGQHASALRQRHVERARGRLRRDRMGQRGFCDRRLDQTDRAQKRDKTRRDPVGSAPPRPGMIRT